jgi:uncharacterized protein (TIGR00269 family)
MKCRKCGGKAVINMRQHRLALCKEHYLEWLPEQTERFILKYHMFSHQERILVAVSGGKDSLSLWDVLSRLGYHVDGLYIDLGIAGGNGYSDESGRMAQGFAAAHSLKLRVVRVVETLGKDIPDFSEQTRRGKGRPCAVCGLAKRHIMNQVARDEGYDVLVTAHNLDDEAAMLFANTLNWQTSLLARQAPVLETSPAGFVRKVKPFCRFYERETAAYALLRGIQYIYDECPFAEGSKSLYYKDLLNRLESSRPGAKLQFYLSFLKAKEQGVFSHQADPDTVLLHACPACGQPTTAPGICAYCRLTVGTV